MNKINKKVSDSAYLKKDINPKLKKVEELSLMNSAYMRKLPFKSRLIFGLLALVPQFRNAMRLMKYDF